MSRISILAAQEAAQKITLPLQVEIDTLKEKVSEIVTGFVKDQIPACILHGFKEHPEYLYRANGFYLTGVGYDRYNVSLEENVPNKNNNYFKVSKEQSKILFPLTNKIEKLIEERKLKIKQIKATILTLGSHKRVSEELPQIIPFLNMPVPVANTGLMIAVQPVRDMIAQLCKDAITK